jgi:hypothetical protein
MDGLTAQWLDAALADDHDTERRLAAQIDVLDARPPNLRAAALRYAHMGWPVFPLATRTKVPAIGKAKGGRGFLDAHCDVSRIDRWWRKYPTHNIGLATGHLFDVIDVDVKQQAGGVNSFLDLLRRGAVYNDAGDVVGNTVIPDVHALAVTATGGMHFYIEPAGEANHAALAPGIDYRAGGGYVVAPPSTLGSHGKSYTWMVTPSPTIRKD